MLLRIDLPIWNSSSKPQMNNDLLLVCCETFHQTRINRIKWNEIEKKNPISNYFRSCEIEHLRNVHRFTERNEENSPEEQIKADYS